MTNRRFQRSTDSHPGHATALHERPTVRQAVRRALFVMAPTAVAVFGAGTATANPEGGVVVRGNATINGGAGTLNVNQASQRAVINWRGFSIGQSETVNFNQPSVSASTLNRVTGAQRSVIEGALNANGRVYLINPSGVLFTGSSQVNVGSLVATTANITDDNFMADRLEFREPGHPGASIENFGQISVRDGGLAALVAPSVRNAGLIQANVGRIALGGGESFTVDFYGDRLINFTVGEGAAAAAAPRVDNSGALLADGGQVLLTTQTASDVVGGVVNMSGVIQARSVSRDATGAIVLDAAGGSTNASGRIDASGTTAGTTGGRVEVLGQSVNLQSGSTIDASGHAGGGTVHVGGPPAGEVSSNRATTAVVEQGATIDASALDSGNGGTVSVWGTDQARFAGQITATGGTSSGDGGFVEVSSRGLLQFLGDVVANARNGAPGTVLLDPDQITIEIERTGSSDPTASVIDGDALTRMLRSGTHVNLTATESITVNHLLDGRPLDGGTTPSGNVRLTASAIVIKAPVITNNAPINLNGGSRGVTIQGDGFVYVANGTGAVGTAPITVVAAGGKIDAIKGGSGNGQLISLGTISLEATADVNLGADLTGLGGAQGASGIGGLVVTSTDGHIAIAGVDARNASVELDAARGITHNGSAIRAAQDITLQGGTGEILIGQVSSQPSVAAIESTGAGDIEFATSGAVTLNGSVLSAGGDIDVGTEDLSPAGVTMASGTVLQAAGSTTGAPQGAIHVYSAGTAALQNLITGSAGDVAVRAGGTISFDAGLFGLPGSQDLDGDLTADGQGIGTLTVESGGSINLAGVTSTGAINLTAANGITNIRGSILTTGAGGNIMLDAGSGPIDLTTSSDTSNIAALEVKNASATITLDTNGGKVTLHDGIRTAGGSIRIGSSDTETSLAGNVTMDPDAVLQTGANTGAVSIYSSGTVALHGINSGDDITLSGASITNSTTSLIAAGDITLTAGAGGLDLNCTGTAAQCDGVAPTSDGDVPPAAIDSGGAVRLASVAATGGALELGGGIKANGNIDIGTPSARFGRVTTSPGVVLTGGASTGNIKIYATEAVTLNGVSAAGGTVTVDTTGGKISNATNSVIASGNIALSAGPEGIMIGTIGNDPRTAGLQATNAGATISLATVGAVDLDSSLRSNGGAIQIGTASVRTGALTMGSTAVLDTSGTAGAVTAYSTGSVVLHGVSAGSVRIDTVNVANDATKRGSITNTGAAIVANGTVILNSGSDGITIKDIGAAGTVAGIDVLALGESITLATSGAVSLSNSLRTRGGSMGIGSDTAGQQVAALTIDKGAVLQTADADNRANGEIRFFADGDIVTGPLILGTNGRVLGRSETSIDIRGAISGPQPTPTSQEPSPQPLDTSIVDLAAPLIVVSGIQAGTKSDASYVRLATPDNAVGEHIDLLGPIRAWGPVHIGYEGVITSAGTTNTALNLSDDVVSLNGDVTINANVILFERWRNASFEWQPEPLSRWDVFRDDSEWLDQFQLAEAGLGKDNNGTGPEDYAQNNEDPNFVANPSNLCGPVSCEYSFSKYVSGDADPPNEIFQPGSNSMRFVRYSLQAEDGEMLWSPFGNGPSLAGYGRSDTDIDFAKHREWVIRSLIGSLTARVEAANGSLSINGDISRSTPVAPEDVIPEPGLVRGTFLNQTLQIVAEGVTLRSDLIGDNDSDLAETGGVSNRIRRIDASGADVLGEVDSNGDALPQLGIPVRGQFSVLTNVGPVVKSSLSDGPTIRLNCYGVGPCDFRSDSGIDVRPVELLFAVEWTQTGKGSSNSRTNDSVIVRVGQAGNATRPNSATGQGGNPTGGTSRDSSSNAGSGTSGSSSTTSDGFSFDSAPTAASDNVASTAEDSQRLTTEDAEQSGEEGNEEDLCPQGAARIADLGQQPGVYGNAPDVFARCKPKTAAAATTAAR